MACKIVVPWRKLREGLLESITVCRMLKCQWHWVITNMSQNLFVCMGSGSDSLSLCNINTFLKETGE